MPRLVVSEKTLELNICAEILWRIRWLLRSRAAFWIGMKQDQEARNGLDELISNLPAGMHLALQSKSPRSWPPNQVPYRFTINDKQHDNLLRLASHRPDAVYYVFPHYNTFTKMRADSPVLLRDTYFLKVEDLRTSPRSTNRLGTHLVESRPPFALVHSSLREAKLTPALDAMRDLFGEERSSLESTLIPHIGLKEWLEELIREAQGNRRAVGQRLRGFSTFCIG